MGLIYPQTPFTPMNLLYGGRKILFRGGKRVLPTRGNLVYEYNPLRNYRSLFDLYRFGSLGRIGVYDRCGNFHQAVLAEISITLSPTVTITYPETKLTTRNIYKLLEDNTIFNTLISLLDSTTYHLITDEVLQWDVTSVYLNTDAISGGQISYKDLPTILKTADLVTKLLLDHIQKVNVGCDGTIDMLSPLEVRARASSLLDLDTPQLEFDLRHPVEIEIQESYDGSVNLILNDDKNYPRLINSRFSTQENGTYQITNHTSANATNIYDSETFSSEISLYKLNRNIPIVLFLGILPGGSMLVGGYLFYFKLADVDGNETDFIAHSQTVVCHIGSLKDPFSIRSGVGDENSGKIINFALLNLDKAYDYVNVYYSRTTSDALNLPLITFGKFIKGFKIKQATCNISLTGFEVTVPVAESDLNTRYEIVDAVKTAAQVLNHLFFGNVHKPEIDHSNLADLSARIIPMPELFENIGNVSIRTYIDYSGKYEYYNALNIYNKVGYWDEEIYRFGIVYILKNTELSPVYPIRGYDTFSKLEDFLLVPIYDKFGNRLKIKHEDGFIKNSKIPLENIQGVVRFNTGKTPLTPDGSMPIGVGMYIPRDVLEELKKSVSGYFFVRLKRIPTVLGLAYKIGLADTCELPTLKMLDDQYLMESFLTELRLLTHTFVPRRRFLKDSVVKDIAAICPEASLRLFLYGSIFNGDILTISRTYHLPQSNLIQTTNEPRIYSQDAVINVSAPKKYIQARVTLVEDGSILRADNELIYRSKAGIAEESWRFIKLSPGEPTANTTDIIRGLFGTYLGVREVSLLETLPHGTMFNIHVNGYSENNMNNYFAIRINDSSSFYPISDRLSIDKETYSEYSELYVKDLFYGGDCFTGNYTHRIIRNFMDPELGPVDNIVDSKTWLNNYKPGNLDDLSKINLGDVNAVQIGHWLTLRVCSNVNISMRDVDGSYPGEIGLTGGNKRSFYPLLKATATGATKLPESFNMNYGASVTTNYLYNFTLPEVPWLKNQFDTRIMYSDVSITDMFLNNYRVFRAGSYRDYPKEYGAITKLVSWHGTLVAVMEHGVLVIPVNERAALSNEAPGGAIYINSPEVLPITPMVLENTFGSTWQDSVCVSDDYIYGVDTIGKKIWRTLGLNPHVELISDFLILKFLNDNITLEEKEKTPFIGIRNVKTHYNPFKKDVIFTFYDNLYGEEEKVWSICFNENLKKWVTFYSWVPSFSAAIDNIFFTFDRNTSKFISKLAQSNSESVEADGICVSNPVFDLIQLRDNSVTITDKDGSVRTITGVIGELDIKNRFLPEELPGIFKRSVEYSLLTDPYGNHRILEIVHDYYDFNQFGIPNTSSDFRPVKAYLRFTDRFGPNSAVSYEELIDRLTYYEWGPTPEEVRENKENKLVYYVYIKADIDYIDYSRNPSRSLLINGLYLGYKTTKIGYYSNVLAIAPYANIVDPETIIPTLVGDRYILKPGLTTSFWKHGQAGIIDIADRIKPTKWYGKIHPFEFEFIVGGDSQSVLKIFNNLMIISNKAEPESFHYTIEGEGYEFSPNKANMYWRQERTKEMFLLYLGSDIIFDRNYFQEHYKEPQVPNKSTLLPLYYDRVDTFDEIYDSYLRITKAGKDYLNLTGGEVTFDHRLDLYLLTTHLKGNNLKKVGRLRGNMLYKEDIWDVEIRPLNLVLKNETDTTLPLVISRVPNFNQVGFDNPDLYNQWVTEYNQTALIPLLQLPSTFSNGFLLNNSHRVSLLSNDNWTSRKETRIRDKTMKVRIRYSGKDLAILSAIITNFTPSYA